MSATLDFPVDREWTPEILNTYLEELAAESGNDVDWRRFEIVDGALVVSPAATRRHEFIVVRLGAALSASAPAGVAVIGSAAIGIGRSYRVTDLTVMDERMISAPDTALAGKDVLLAVEIESRSSVTTDRVTKPAQYAAAGIGHYWRVETDPLRLTAYRLDGETYAEVGSWGSDEIARISEPVEVEIDLSTLLPA